MSQKPTIGRIVIYCQGDMEAIEAEYGPLSDWISKRDSQPAPIERSDADFKGVNGTRFHPAMITQVWSETCVNLTVMFADGTVAARQSASLLPDELFADGVHCANSGWRWPPAAAR